MLGSGWSLRDGPSQPVANFIKPPATAGRRTQRQVPSRSFCSYPRNGLWWLQVSGICRNRCKRGRSSEKVAKRTTSRCGGFQRHTIGGHLLESGAGRRCLRLSSHALPRLLQCPVSLHRPSPANAISEKMAKQEFGGTVEAWHP